MSKIITSEIKKFPGTVTLSDPISYPQYERWSKAWESQLELSKEERETLTNEKVMWAEIMPMVEKWELENFDPNKPPAAPRVPVIELLIWLVTEVGKIINEGTDPNA
jgi:hypothetical protein